MNFLHRKRSIGLIFHSDRGVQYPASRFRSTLKAAGLPCSTSRGGNCYDNAAMENFWSTPKLELVHRRSFVSRIQANADLFDCIEVSYDRKRHHTALGSLSETLFKPKTPEKN